MANTDFEVELKVVPTIDIQTANLALSVINLYLHQNSDKCLYTQTNDDGTKDYTFGKI